MTSVAICDYGAGNTRSVAAAFTRLGARVEVTADARTLAACDVAVLPGVGSAASAMRTLRGRGLDRVLRDRVASGRDVLGICLGLQIASEGSDEDGGVEGLGLLPGRAVRLERRPLPRIGWADVDPWGTAFYFAHAYALRTPAVVATSDGVTAAARSGSFLGVQFHPEKSGAAGAGFLRRTCIRA